MNIWLKRLLFNIQFLTRFPVKIKLDVDETDMARGMALFPIVALLVGAANACALALAWAWTGNALVSALAVAAMNAYITGGLHIDGLSDVCDGVFSGRDKTKALEIMRDSRMGAFGGVGLFMDLAARFALMAALIPRGLGFAVCAAIAAPVVGRMAQLTASLVGRSAREGMGSVYVKGMDNRVWGAGLLIALALCVALLGMRAIWVTPVFLILPLMMVRFFDNRLGGITGDCLGAVNELAEIVALLVLAGRALA